MADLSKLCAHKSMTGSSITCRVNGQEKLGGLAETGMVRVAEFDVLVFAVGGILLNCVIALATTVRRCLFLAEPTTRLLPRSKQLCLNGLF